MCTSIGKRHTLVLNGFFCSCRKYLKHKIPNDLSKAHCIHLVSCHKQLTPVDCQSKDATIFGRRLASTSVL